MEHLSIVFRLLALSQIVLFLLALLLSKNPIRIKVCGALLLLSISAYLLLPIAFNYLQGLPLAETILLVFMANITSSLLLMFAWVLFQERQAIPLWVIVLALLDFIMTAWSLRDFSIDMNASELSMLLHLYRLILVIITMIIVWRDLDDDLVALRQKLRYGYISSVSIAVIVILIAEMVTRLEIPMAMDVIGMGMIFILALSINLAFFKVNPQFYLLAESKPILQSSEDPDVSKLLSRMKSERLFANHDLRVGTLADLIGLPEYQLRKKINQNLGYQNFNQFVNHYRISEASERLLSEPRTPVLSIALDVGFRSISSFNTAFQKQFNMSPTEFRSSTKD